MPLLAVTGSEKSAKSALSNRSGLGHHPTHGDDFFLTGKWAHVTSRDICLCVYFAMLLLLPATGLLVALLAGNPHANSWQSSVRHLLGCYCMICAHRFTLSLPRRRQVGEICGYIYIQMAFTTFVIILPGWLARYVLLTRRPFINQTGLPLSTRLPHAHIITM